jgi:PAS domain S-box-containing protein
MLDAMISRPKPKPVRAFTSHILGNENGRKDQLLCRLELQQTVYVETIRKLERNCDELETLRRGFSLLYDRSPIGYITFDKRGHIHNANAIALQLLGFERNRLMHLPLAFLVQQEDLKKLLNHLWRCEHDNAPTVVTDVHLRRKDQTFVPVQLASAPLTQVNQRQMFLTAIVDMTEQIRHEQALAETKEFAEAIVETVRHPLAVLDQDLRIISVNRAFTEFFRRSAQYIRGRVFEVMLNLWWSGNRLRNELEKVLVKQEPLENYRVEVNPPDLGKRVLVVNARKLHQKDGVPDRILVSLEDITELESARESLRKTNDELERRVASRTEALQKSYEHMEAFCYSIAHDLRAPLRSMTGFSQLLSEDFNEQMTEAARDYAQRIQQSGERMDQMIRDLLCYGRLNTVPLDTTSVDLDKVFQEVVAAHEKDIREKRAKVQRKGPLPVVCGHHSVLHAVLANLISNGLKFVATDVRPQIDVSAEVREDWARVWVADNGIGIAPEHRSKIFGVFQRLHSVDTYPGTGIGLAIVARGVERMGGRVGLESKPNKGSRFWFELPKQKGNGTPKKALKRFKRTLPRT